MDPRETYPGFKLQIDTQENYLISNIHLLLVSIFLWLHKLFQLCFDSYFLVNFDKNNS